MKLRNKVIAGLAATVLALSMMIGTAMAGTDVLPFAYPNDANAATNNDVWVVLFGGTAATPMTDDVAIRDSIKSVDVAINGNATFDAEIIANMTAGWLPTTFAAQTVATGTELVINMPFDAKDAGYAECVVSLKNKTEGALEVSRIDFKDADGNVVLTKGVAAAAAPVADDAAATDTAVPQTGVLSFALLFGLGAVTLGTGSVVLKKKER